MSEPTWAELYTRRLLPPAGFQGFKYPTLQNFQFEYNGLVFGANTQYGILGADGIDLGENARSGDQNWGRDHGQALGLDLMGGRDILFDLWLKPITENLQKLQFNLAKATQVQPNEAKPLFIQLPNMPLLYSMCRPWQRKTKIESDYSAGAVAKPELAFHATDPRLYEETFPFESNLKEAHAGETLVTAEIGNPGSVETRPILVIAGAKEPKVINTSLTGTPNIALKGFPKSTELVVVDFGPPHTIIKYQKPTETTNLSANWMKELKSESVWWNLPSAPLLFGGVSKLQFRATSNEANAFIRIYYAPAYML